MKKPIIHKKLSEKEIHKRHKANTMDQELHKIIEGDEDNALKVKFNNLLEKAFKSLKS